jgi:hypothetical protein
VPIITTETMLRYDPRTFVVYATPDAPRRRPQPLGRVLCGFAIAGLTARALELLVNPRRR